ncbi:MAG TPA: hypothetical protein DCP92_12755 [Nitrospiraceae bacterium]|jgi:hypothetical protein|nr:hypothetical protein [Nitrospiraceae bacterium]
MTLCAQKFDRSQLFLMTRHTALVAYHLCLLSLEGLLHSLSMASEAILEAESIMHLDHFGIAAVWQNIAAGEASRLTGAIHMAINNVKSNNAFMYIL